MSQTKRRCENVRVLIEEAKLRKKLNNPQLARKLGMSTRTLDRRKDFPADLTLAQFWVLADMVEMPEEDKKKYV